MSVDLAVHEGVSGRTRGALSDGLRHEQQRKQLETRELEQLGRVAAVAAEQQHQRRVQDQEHHQDDAAPESNARRPARPGSEKSDTFMTGVGLGSTA